MHKTFLFITMWVGFISGQASDMNLAALQLPRFKNKTLASFFRNMHEFTTGPIGILTTSYGSPVDKSDTSTYNSNLIQNVHFMESAARIVRERIPDRVVHAIGAGAFGYFNVTHDITRFCKAKLFESIGKITPVAVRFSPVGGEKGDRDNRRGVKGFAVKFYTEEGNYDLVCLDTPVFVINDPLMFPGLVHSSRRNPVTNLPDPNMLWDFLSLRPESTHSVLLSNGDGGLRDGFRRLPGFAIHTFQVVNKVGEIYFFRFHLLPEGGVQNLTPEEAQRIANVDANYATRDLYNAIERGDFPVWILYIQVLTLEDVKKAEVNVFDVTKELSIEKYPLHPVGKLVLNKNPNNYFADVEQMAFNPANLVPGIEGGLDKTFQARSMMYRDAEIYRLGINFNNIPVNCPMLNRPLNYQRGGVAPVNENGGDAPNYYPNTFNGPVPRKNSVKLMHIFEDDSYSFEQSRDLYINRMTEGERSRVVQNIVSSLGGAIPRIQTRAINLFTLVHPDLGMRLNQSLQANTP